MAGPSLFKIRLTLTPDKDGGFVVTSPDLPELVTEGETAEGALANVRDAFEAVRELYGDLRKRWPASTAITPGDGSVEFEALIDRLESTSVEPLSVSPCGRRDGCGADNEAIRGCAVAPAPSRTGVAHDWGTWRAREWICRQDVGVKGGSGLPSPRRGESYSVRVPPVALEDSLHRWLHPAAPLGPRAPGLGTMP